jgi:dihydrodipicolinate synthase/N-acetylneuraminate lyase
VLVKAFLAGTGANSTREAIELTKAAKELGADAALLVTPYYNTFIGYTNNFFNNLCVLFHAQC